ncbi:MAG: TetR family transcriptional regulator [Burkholderiales bacterium]|jgi:TetR/AcrR family acrAB operon transcriptional repressor
MARRTKEEAKETRNRILDTAEKVFVKKGVSNTSLAQLAQAAGLSRGAIYWHFRNKADLFDAMMKRVVLPMEEMAARAGDDKLDDPLEHVRSCAINVLHHLTTDAQCQRVFEICCHKVEYVDEMAQVRRRHIQARNNCLNHMERGLRNAASKGLLASSVDPRSAAVGLHALVDGLIVNWVLDPAYLPLAREAKTLVDRYIQSLVAIPGKPPSRRVSATGRAVRVGAGN